MDVDYVITLDADGQHLPEDVASLALAARHPHTSVLLGVRKFGDAVPLRSLFGNRLTQWVFWKLSGMRVSDTQTGLRLLSTRLLGDLAALHGDRYEYEMNMLAYFARQKIDVQEVQIQTVYIEGNKSSHFRPLIDSARIYYVLFREAIVSLSSFGMDIALFTIFHALTHELLLSTCAARTASAIYNFLGHKFFVFAGRQRQALGAQILEYGALVLCFMAASYFGVRLLTSHSALNPVLAKILVDSTLYVSSFLIRRHLIFRLSGRQ